MALASTSPSEREALLEFLRAKREDATRTATGLDEDQLRWTPPGALLPIIGVLNHLAKMEWRWVEGRYLGLPFPERSEEFVLDRSITGADVLAAYAAQAARTEHVVRQASSLDEECLGDEGGRGPAHVILGLDRPVTLRWALLHVLEETAHHCGHADSTRELLDGHRQTRP